MSQHVPDRLWHYLPLWYVCTNTLHMPPTLYNNSLYVNGLHGNCFAFHANASWLYVTVGFPWFQQQRTLKKNKGQFRFNLLKSFCIISNLCIYSKPFIQIKRPLYVSNGISIILLRMRIYCEISIQFSPNKFFFSWSKNRHTIEYNLKGNSVKYSVSIGIQSLDYFHACSCWGFSTTTIQSVEQGLKIHRKSWMDEFNE